MCPRQDKTGKNQCIKHKRTNQHFVESFYLYMNNEKHIIYYWILFRNIFKILDGDSVNNRREKMHAMKKEFEVIK